MSKRDPYQFSEPVAGEKVYWRSLEEQTDPSPEFLAKLEAEFPAGASELVDPVTRRTFLTLMSASVALAGVEGCARRPVEHVVPYTHAPEGVIPGVAQHYATVIERRGDALGLVVECHEGRPTKVEGNADHPASGGGADMLAQAAVLDLYDPDRSRQPMMGNERKTFREFELALEQRLTAAAAAGTGGAGLRILAQPTNSPTFVRLRQAVLARFPAARFHTYAPVNSSNAREGARMAFGRVFNALPHYDRARVIVSLDSDFLQTEPGMVRATREFATGRRLRTPTDNMNRLYVVESVMTTTGSNADHRLRLPARDIERYALALAAALQTRGVAMGEVGTAAATGPQLEVPAPWLAAVADELAHFRGESLVVVGSRQPPLVHAVAHAINHALGNGDRTVTYTPVADPDEQPNAGSLRALVDDMRGDHVTTLLILGGNPVYDAPRNLNFAEALGRVQFRAHLSGTIDETSTRCTWHAPRAHEFECWGDQVSLDGTLAVQQPLIAPLFNGHSDIEVLAVLAAVPGAERNGLALVRGTHAATAGGPVATDRDWRRALNRGTVARPEVQLPVGMAPVGGDIARQLAARRPGAALGPDNLEVVFIADAKMLDGRHANNAWLLELPDPLTKITWDNAAYVSPATARALRIHSGDMIRLAKGNASVEIVAWELPGQADNSIALPLGWGRTHAGRLGNGKGFDVNGLRTAEAMDFTDGVRVTPVGRRYPISQTQEHHSMEGRPIAIEATLAEFRAQPNFAEHRSPTPRALPLWREVDYTGRHKWGMVIDLNACTGCNACVIACQSENNIPVVGKDQVSRGREMHWLRIDRYFSGSIDDPQVVHQPLACVHCEEAPCENVCPVNATSHSPEGLNEMTYNRCIGTRYCANNCPYKVRRFNYLNWHNDGVFTMDQLPETVRMQHNPNVTVRARGVMEKCTYCVQRIQSAKISTRRENRPLRDTAEANAVTPACAQTCPSEAIAFGDLNDPGSRVSEANRRAQSYKLLAEIGTQPRTSYLGKVRNPNPAMGTAPAGSTNTEQHG